MTVIHPIRLRLSNAFLVLGERPVLIDTGSPGEGERILAELHRHGVQPDDLSLILLTHAHTDHAGSAKFLREQTGAPVALHPADAAMLKRGTMGAFKPRLPRHYLLKWYVNQPFAGLQADVELAEGQRLDEFGMAATVIETPGHSAGSVSIMLDAADASSPTDAIVGDLVIGGFLGGLFDPHRPRWPYFAEDYQQVGQSIDRLLPLAGGNWHLGHGGPVDASHVQPWREAARRG